MHCLGSLGELLHKPGSKYTLHKPQPKVYSGAKKNVSLAIIRWPVGGCRYRAQSTRDGLSETIYLSRFCDWGFKVSTGMYELKMNLSPLVYPLCKILRTLSSSQLGPLHVVKGFSNDFYDIWGPPTIFSLSLLILVLVLQAKEREDSSPGEKGWLQSHCGYWAFIGPTTGTVSLISSGRHGRHTSLCVPKLPLILSTV